MDKTTGRITNSTKRRAVTAILAGLAVLAVGSAYGASDSGANGGVLQPDGKIVAAGWVRAYASNQAAFGLMRYRSGGTLDKTFGFGGMVATSAFHGDGARAVSLQPNGEIVVAGTSANGRFRNSWAFGLARYKPNGPLDRRFGTSGRVRTTFSSPSYATALALQRDGKIVAAGTVLGKKFPNQAGFAFARYRQNGTLDTGFGTRGRVITRFGGRCALAGGQPVVGQCGSALAMAIQPDGKIIAAGSSCGGFCDDYQHPYPPDTIALVRYKRNGTLDSTFGSGGLVKTDIGVPAEARSLALQPDGKIVVAGVELASGDLGDPHYEFVVARYSPNGSLDGSFGAGGTTTTDFLDCGCLFPYGAEANALLVQPDGKIVAGGHTLDPEPETRDAFALARYNADGSLDTGFGGGGTVTTSFGLPAPDFPAYSGDVINALALQPDRKLVAIGYSNYGEHQEQYVFSLARYAPDGTLDPSFGTEGKVTTTLSLCLVPRLRGGPLSYAKKALKQSHCGVGKVSKRFSHVRRSWVVGSRPGAGAVRREGAKIRLFVSKGRRRPRG